MPNKKQKSPAHEFISFRIGQESFAVEAVNVREVLKNKTITEVPGMPDFLPGVINLRGNVISVIDPGVILNIGNIHEQEKTWLVIIEAFPDDECLQVGMRVETVEDVIRLKPDQISHPPDIGMEFDSAFARGIGKQEGEYTVILDIDRIISFVISETAPQLSEHNNIVAV